CGSSAPGPLHHTGSSPPTAGPEVTWGQAGFETPRLPAVSADGELVVLAYQDIDGGRGNPNLRLVTVDRRDTETGRHVVLAADDADQLIGPDPRSPELDARIAEANRWLGELHGRRALVALAPLAEDNAPDVAPSERTRAAGGGVTVEWKGGQLRITQDGKVVVDRATPPQWLAEDRPIPPEVTGGELEKCSNAAFLGGAAVDVEHEVAVITVSYTGTDLCWEPANQQHVVAW
ncbi:MAG: hypothetical protein ACTHU0_26120, partial [Kofleriaceae bacterium]